MQSEFTSSYRNLDEISLFSVSESFQSNSRFEKLTFADNSNEDCLSNLFSFNHSVSQKKSGLSELFIDPPTRDSIQPELQKEMNYFHEVGEFSQKEISQTNTKLHSQETSQKSSEDLNIQKALRHGNNLSFDYLNSKKIYDPKRLPIEDKGKMYYYQDDPALYKKIKK